MSTEVGRDAEISALEVLIAALEPLDDEARARVLEYTLRRLGMHELPVPLSGADPALQPPSVPPPIASDDRGVTDIRTLREQKAPSSANEMAALAAYYLADLAPATERKGAVASADIERLFKQANYRLPSRIAMALPNAAAAGYFDKDRGRRVEAESGRTQPPHTDSPACGCHDRKPGQTEDTQEADCPADQNADHGHEQDEACVCT